MKHYSPVRPTIKNIKKLDNDLTVIGMTGYYAPITQGNSAARTHMTTVQSQQLLTPLKPEVPIILSGGETEMAKYTFDDIMPCTAFVVAKVSQYTSLSSKDIPFTLIYREEETGVYDFIDVTPYMTNHVKFGHKKIYEPIIRNISPGDVLTKGLRLTKTASIHEGEIFSNLINANSFYCSHPATTEDGFMVNTESMKNYAPLAVGEVSTGYGSTSFPVLCYGKPGSKRPFPTQGERIREDGMVYAIRDYDETWDWLITHKSQLDKPDRIFDVCMRAEPGAEVTDVEVFTTRNDNKRLVTNPEISASLEVYHNRKLSYSKNLIQQYTKIMQESRAVISPALMRKFAEAFLVDPNNKELIGLLPPSEVNAFKRKEREKRNKKFIRTNKNAELDEFNVTIRYAWRYKVTKGAKLSDQSGGKGVICEMAEPKDMFTDEYGNVADIVIFTKAVTGRMNADQLYYQAITAFLMAIQYDCRKHIADGNYEAAWTHILNAYKIVSPITYDSVISLTESDEDKKYHLDAVCAEGKRIHVTIRADSTHVNELMYKAIMEYRPPLKSKITFTNLKGERETLRKKGVIAPKTIGILEKTQHNNLAENTAQTQHHGLPTSTSTKGEHACGIKQHAPKIFSETEGRMMSNVVGAIPVAKIMEQANSTEVSEAMAASLFSSSSPMGNKSFVDRTKIPMGGNAALCMIRHEFNCVGIEIHGNDAKSLSDSIGWNKR